MDLFNVSFAASLQKTLGFLLFGYTSGFCNMLLLFRSVVVPLRELLFLG